VAEKIKQHAGCQQDGTKHGKRFSNQTYQKCGRNKERLCGIRRRYDSER
jgi:hypothetical protein